MSLSKRLVKIMHKIYAPKYLLAANTATIVGFYALGDVIVQTISSNFSKPLETERIKQVSIVGLVHGPMSHYFYQYLDHYVKHRRKSILVLKKVIADFAASPVFASTYIAGCAILEGASAKAAIQEYIDKFFSVLKMDICIWPPSQFINFYFLPPNLRVFYVSCIVLVYGIGLTYIKHQIKVE